MGRFDQLSREEARQLRAAIDDRLEMLAKLRKSAQARGISTDEIDEAIFVLEGADGKGGLRYHLTHQLELLNEAAATDPLFRAPAAAEEPPEEEPDEKVGDAAWIEEEEEEQAGEPVDEGEPLPAAQAEDGPQPAADPYLVGLSQPATVMRVIEGSAEEQEEEREQEQAGEVVEDASPGEWGPEPEPEGVGGDPLAVWLMNEEREEDAALRAMLPAELPKVATDQVLEDIVRRYWSGDDIPWPHAEGSILYEHKRADGTVALCYADGSDGFPLDWWYGLPEDAYIDEVEPTLSDAELLARIRRVAGVLTPDEMPVAPRTGARVEVEGETRLYRIAEVQGDYIALQYYKTSAGLRAIVGAVPRRGLKAHDEKPGYWSPGPFLTPEELERELARAAAEAPAEPVPEPENVCTDCFVEYVDGACPECGALQNPEPIGAVVE